MLTELKRNLADKTLMEFVNLQTRQLKFVILLAVYTVANIMKILLTSRDNEIFLAEKKRKQRQNLQKSTLVSKVRLCTRGMYKCEKLDT